MTGQDAVNSAEDFHRRLGLTGVVLTKIDGDARGGAALSIRHATGQPIKFIGTAKNLTHLNPSTRTASWGGSWAWATSCP